MECSLARDPFVKIVGSQDRTQNYSPHGFDWPLYFFVVAATLKPAKPLYTAGTLS